MSTVFCEDGPRFSPWGKEIAYFASLDSTSRYLKREARNGAPAGRVVVAARQTAGYGRRGRAWHSPPGCNLYFSVLLRPELDFFIAPQLSLVAAAALKLALDEDCPGLQIKWPNDLYAGESKLAGILAEMEPGTAGPAFVVLGIGLNVNAGRDDFPPELRDQATSLKIVSGRDFALGALLTVILERLAELEKDFLRHGLAGGIAALINANFHLAGREVILVSGENEIRGRALGIDDAGRLRLATPGGELCSVSAGEAHLRKVHS